MGRAAAVQEDVDEAKKVAADVDAPAQPWLRRSTGCAAADAMAAAAGGVDVAVAVVVVAVSWSLKRWSL